MTYSSEASCISVVATGTQLITFVNPTRVMVWIDIRIDCVGTWDIDPASISWFPTYGGAPQAMTWLDLDGVFPITVLPGQEGMIVTLFWDSEADGMFAPDAYGLGICLGLAPVVAGGDDPPPPPPPPPPPDTPVFPPEDVTIPPVGPGVGEDPGTTPPDGDEPPVTDPGDDPPSIGGAGDQNPGGETPEGGVENPGNIETGNVGGGTISPQPEGEVVIPPANTPNIRIRHVDKPVAPQDGANAPPLLRPADSLSSDIPVARIGEPREIIPQTRFSPRGVPGLRPAGGVGISGPGQVIPTPDEQKMDIITTTGDTGVIGDAVFLPGPESLIGVPSKTIPIKMDYPSIGDVMTGRSIRPNPVQDILTTEPGGTVTGSDPALLHYKDTLAGGRKEPVSWYPVNDPPRTTVNHAPVVPGAGKKTEGATSDREAQFSLFSTPAIPSDGSTSSSFVAPGGRSLSTVSTQQDPAGVVPTRVQPNFHNVLAQSKINDGLGNFYGTPVLKTSAGEMPQEAFAGNQHAGALSIEVRAHPSEIMSQDKVTTMSVNLRNRSLHADYPGSVIVAGFYDASGTFTRLAHQKLDLEAAKSSAISITVPKNCPPGPIEFVGILHGEDGRVHLGGKCSGYVLPEGAKPQDFRPGDLLTTAVMRSLGMKSSSTPLTEGRAWPYRVSQYGTDFTAKGEVVAGAIKITQAGADRGFNSQVVVTVDPLGTPSSFTFTERVKVGAADLDPMCHDTAFTVSGVTAGDRVRIQVESQLPQADPRYAWQLYSDDLEPLTGLTIDTTGNGTYLDGVIETPISNGHVRIHNSRTNSQIRVNTDNTGVVLVPEVTGDDTGQLPVPPDQGTGNLIFDAIPGDQIIVVSPGSAGAYNPFEDGIGTGDVSYDTGSTLQPADTGSPVSLPDPPSSTPIDPPTFAPRLHPRPVGWTPVGPDIPGGGLAPPVGTDGLPTVDDPDPTVPDIIIPPPPPSISSDMPPPPPPVVEIAWIDPEVIPLWSVLCGTICQRPENPCIVDVTVQIEGSGSFVLVPELCMFSVDTTDCFDGNWFKLNPILNDAKFSGLGTFNVNGGKSFNFPVDMCDHISTFFSETAIWFRLTFAVPGADLSEYGVV